MGRIATSYNEKKQWIDCFNTSSESIQPFCPCNYKVRKEGDADAGVVEGDNQHLIYVQPVGSGSEGVAGVAVAGAVAIQPKSFGRVCIDWPVYAKAEYSDSPLYASSSGFVSQRSGDSGGEEFCVVSELVDGLGLVTRKATSSGAWIQGPIRDVSGSTGTISVRYAATAVSDQIGQDVDVTDFSGKLLSSETEDGAWAWASQVVGGENAEPQWGLDYVASNSGVFPSGEVGWLATFRFGQNTHAPTGALGSVVVVPSTWLTVCGPKNAVVPPNLSVSNPYGLLGLTGDTGLAAIQPALGGGYTARLVNVYPEVARRFFATWRHGSGGSSQGDGSLDAWNASGLVATHDGGSLPFGDLQPEDLFDINNGRHEVGDLGICEYNLSRDQYVLTHVKSQFRVALAYVKDDFSGGPSEFVVEGVAPFDGYVTDDKRDNLNVLNTFSIPSLFAGDPVIVVDAGYYYYAISCVMNPVFPVSLATSGGSQGTADEPASWNYDVTDLYTGDTLLYGANPVASPHKWKRPDVGAMTEATFGLAVLKKSRIGDGQVVLTWINEMPEQEACPEEE